MTQGATADIPFELLETIRSRDAVVFAGAGLSIAAGLPSGRTLANELATRLDEFDGERDDLTEVATAYEALRSRHDLVSYLTRRVIAATPDKSRTHDLLSQLPWATVVTTNWDTLIEDAFGQASIAYAQVVEDSDVPFIAAATTPVMKIHGSVRQPASLVVTERDFFDLHQKGPGQVGVLETLFATKTILFLGFSLGDPDVKQFFYRCSMMYGPLRRPAYAVQLAPSETTRASWSQQNLKIIASDATRFLEKLLLGLGGPS